jgi:hypothetical protein
MGSGFSFLWGSGVLALLLSAIGETEGGGAKVGGGENWVCDSGACEVWPGGG